jgi:hypothetical protein
VLDRWHDTPGASSMSGQRLPASRTLGTCVWVVKGRPIVPCRGKLGQTRVASTNRSSLSPASCTFPPGISHAEWGKSWAPKTHGIGTCSVSPLFPEQNANRSRRRSLYGELHAGSGMRADGRRFQGDDVTHGRPDDPASGQEHPCYAGEQGRLHAEQAPDRAADEGADGHHPL